MTTVDLGSWKPGTMKDAVLHNTPGHYRYPDQRVGALPVDISQSTAIAWGLRSASYFNALHLTNGASRLTHGFTCFLGRNGPKQKRYGQVITKAMALSVGDWCELLMWKQVMDPRCADIPSLTSDWPRDTVIHVRWICLPGGWAPIFSLPVGLQRTIYRFASSFYDASNWMNSIGFESFLSQVQSFLVGDRRIAEVFLHSWRGPGGGGVVNQCHLFLSPSEISDIY
jgi:hypothetical protein